MIKNTFEYRREEKKNPYIGFVSFQHFRGDPLYTDSVVDPNGDLCETEDFECYPVPEGIEENGDLQGFYPDGTVAYLRVLWKEFEPERGKYNYGFIEKMLRTAESRGQTVMFRLMPHSTCARDDVPDWLRKIVDCPERPPRSRFKDSPSDPKWVELFLDAIRALGRRFDSDRTLDIVDISTVGAWGEGHKRDEYPPELLVKIIDTFTESFPTTMLLCQMSTPHLLIHAQNGGKRPIGTRADAMGQPYHREEVYPMFLKNLPTDIWKTAPLSGESYWWLGEWKRQGWDPHDAFEYMLGLHLSTFNGKYLPIPFDWKNEVEWFEDRLGYHFSLRSFEYGEKPALSGNIGGKLTIENTGCAPIYHRIPLRFRLSREKEEYVTESTEDIRTWLPGEHSVNVSIPVPADATPGRWNIEVSVSGAGFPPVWFCSDNERNGDWFKIGDIDI